MRILMIRHGDPDYQNDTLTERGIKEAKALAALAPSMNLGDCYQSPLGRAQKTASYVLEAVGKTAETCDWLREFPAVIDVKGDEELERVFPDYMMPDGTYRKHIVWDMMPWYYTKHPEILDPGHWRECRVAQESDMLPIYDHVIASFDALLAKYGYVREGGIYRVERETKETVTFFCHFGITAVLLSHLWNVSPFAPLHNMVSAPTGVTELFTEERAQGVAHFRAARVGDISHLVMAGLEPSFSARFCEVYSDPEQRH